MHHKNDFTWFIPLITLSLVCPRNTKRQTPVSTSSYSPWMPRQFLTTRPRPHIFFRFSSTSIVCPSCVSVFIRWSGPPQQRLSCLQQWQLLMAILDHEWVNKKKTKKYMNNVHYICEGWSVDRSMNKQISWME